MMDASGVKNEGRGYISIVGHQIMATFNCFASVGNKISG